MTQGVMAGYDQKSNVVLSDSKERVYSTDKSVEEISLGLYLVKGDQMCAAIPLSPLMFSDQCFHRVLIGELDEDLEKSVDLSAVRAEPLPPIRY